MDTHDNSSEGAPRRSKVLVVYASKHHGTEEIASEIAERLRAAKHRVTVQPISEVADLTSYDAVVLGSAIYEENWLPEAEAFLSREFDTLKARPLWLYSSGVLMTLGLSSRVWLPRTLRPISRALKPRGIICFGGKLEHTRLDREDRRRNPDLLALEGDYRDWGIIDTWASDISRSLARDIWRDFMTDLCTKSISLGRSVEPRGTGVPIFCTKVRKQSWRGGKP